MRLWTASFPGHWIGGHALIVGGDEAEARTVLATTLAQRGLTGADAEPKLSEIDPTAAAVHVLSDGDY